MSREPKVMWSARLPGGLTGQIAEAAEEEGVSQGELVEQALGEWFDDRRLRADRDVGLMSLAEVAARSGLARIETFLGDGMEHAKVVVCCQIDDEDGAVLGTPGDPVALFADTVEFATIAGAVVGKRLRVLRDGG
jgi:hypothetical protein